MPEEAGTINNSLFPSINVNGNVIGFIGYSNINAAYICYCQLDVTVNNGQPPLTIIGKKKKF